MVSEKLFIVRGNEMPPDFKEVLRRTETMYRTSGSSTSALPRICIEGMYVSGASLRNLPDKHSDRVFDLEKAMSVDASSIYFLDPHIDEVRYRGASHSLRGSKVVLVTIAYGDLSLETVSEERYRVSA